MRRKRDFLRHRDTGTQGRQTHTGNSATEGQGADFSHATQNLEAQRLPAPIKAGRKRKQIARLKK